MPPIVEPRPIARHPDGLRDALSGLLEYSDLMDTQLRLRLAAFREGYDTGRETGYAQGYADGVLDRKHTQQDIYEALRLSVRRWELRGEPRSQGTFGRPHPGDYPGMAV